MDAIRCDTCWKYGLFAVDSSVWIGTLTCKRIGKLIDNAYSRIHTRIRCTW